MSLPGYNPIHNINHTITTTNNNNMNSFLGDLQQQQPHGGGYPPPPPSSFHHPYHDNKNSVGNMFSIPPPPLLGVPPPLFDRDISPPRKRTRTSPEQLAVLEKSFSTNSSPNNRVREQLSHQLGMPERSIQIWFQNRRAKVKNQVKRTVQMQDSTLYIQQQYAASAAAAACQSVAFQQQRDTIDPNLYYYYYYYYFHQQQQQAATAVAMDNEKRNSSSSLPPPNAFSSYSTPPNPSSSYSTPTTTIIPDLSLSASTSSSSNTSDIHHHRRNVHVHHRSASSTTSSITTERARAHSVGPYPYYRKSTSQERHSSLGPPPTTPTSTTTPTMLQQAAPPPPPANQFLFNNNNDSRLYNSSTIIEEPYHIQTEGSIMNKQGKYNLSAQTLQIGSWKRVCDLTCHIDLSTRTLVWCIGDEKQRFRIDINLNLVQFIKTSQHRLEFFLSSPLQVKFYMTDNNNNNWIQCHDFTQDKQASLENIHILECYDDDLLRVELMEILMQAPELQSLIIEEKQSSDNTMDNNLLLLQGLHLP